MGAQSTAAMIMDDVARQGRVRKEALSGARAATDDLITLMWEADRLGHTRNSIIEKSGMARQSASDVLQLRDLYLKSGEVLREAGIPVNDSFEEREHLLLSRKGTRIGCVVMWETGDQHPHEARDAARERDMAARAVRALARAGLAVKGDPAEEWAVITSASSAPQDSSARARTPAHRIAGSNPERQSVGLPGHCESCAAVGHIDAHPNLGCSDVGCTISHG